jgi:hypothetical protein
MPAFYQQITPKSKSPWFNFPLSLSAVTDIEENGTYPYFPPKARSKQIAKM